MNLNPKAEQPVTDPQDAPARSEHTPIPLYHHRTDGGAEYLSDAFIQCDNGHREGIFEGAEYIVRLDGEPHLTVRAAPDLLTAAESVIACWERGDLAGAVRALDFEIKKAKGEHQ